MIHHGIPHTGGHIKHGVDKGTANGRVAHNTHNSGTISGGHAGLPPNIMDSGAKAYDDLCKARSKSHTSKHEVRVHGGKFSGRVKHGR